MLEELEKRLEHGEKLMKKLTTCQIKDVIQIIEKELWEDCYSKTFYTGIHNGEFLKKEYKNRKITVEYNADLEIEKIEISWNFYDSVHITLSAIGLIATYSPEHGVSKTLIDLPWLLLKPVFFK